MSKFLQPPPCCRLVTERVYWPKLIRCMLHRVLLAGIGGLWIGLVAKFTDLSSLGYAETVFAASFWVAALMVPTFKGDVGRSLFWLLLLEAGLTLYQVSIYMVVLDEYVLVRLGPVILAGVLFIASCGGRWQNSSLYIIWIACNLPALIPIFLQDQIKLTDAIVFWAFNIFYPLIFYFAVRAIKRASFPQQILADFISFTLLIMCLVPLLLIPIEMALRQTESLASLQFGGHAYSVTGAVFLLLPILLHSLSQWRLSLRYVATGLILLLLITSFSRGVVVVFVLLAIGIFVFSNVHRGKYLKSFVFTIIILFGVGYFLMPDAIFEAGWYWLLRMNMVSNLSSSISVDAAGFLETDRSEIWKIAVSLFADSPLWGHGIGSTPSLVSTATSNEFSYSGMHNLILTVLTERGLTGLAGVLVLLGRIGYLIYVNKHLPVSRMLMGYTFVLFLVFANGTGVELFLNSSRSMNVSITIDLFLLIGYLEYRPGKTRPNASTVNMTTRTVSGCVS